MSETKAAPMSTERTPGQWQLGKVFADTPGAYPKRNIYAFDEQHICRVIADDTRAENAERIVACVNACEGIVDPDLALYHYRRDLGVTNAETDTLRRQVATRDADLRKMDAYNAQLKAQVTELRRLCEKALTRSAIVHPGFADEIRAALKVQS